MFTVDLSIAVAIYILLCAVGILILWVFFEGKRLPKKFISQDKFVWQCSICAHVYIDTKDAVISQCPRCQSYNKR